MHRRATVRLRFEQLCHRKNGKSIRELFDDTANNGILFYFNFYLIFENSIMPHIAPCCHVFRIGICTYFLKLEWQSLQESRQSRWFATGLTILPLLLYLFICLSYTQRTSRSCLLKSNTNACCAYPTKVIIYNARSHRSMVIWQCFACSELDSNGERFKHRRTGSRRWSSTWLCCRFVKTDYPYRAYYTRILHPEPLWPLPVLA